VREVRPVDVVVVAVLVVVVVAWRASCLWEGFHDSALYWW